MMSDVNSSARPRWVLPAVVLVLWVVGGAVLSIFIGKLAEVQENDNAAFLPRSAESTEALDALLEFQGEETYPTTVVFHRPGGLTEEDEAAIAGYAARFADVEDVIDGGVAAPVFSENREAAQVVVTAAGSDGEQVIETVTDLREVVTDLPDGLEGYAGGVGGVSADFTEAFGAIDGVLTIVALLVVLVILLVVYRSPVLPAIVLAGAGLALAASAGVIYALARGDVLTLNGQSQGVFFILAIGASTDYSLLLLARFREELRDHESKYDAMRAAYRAAFAPIVASGLTVIIGLLCLLLSDLAWLSGLGPVGAIAVAASMLSALTFVPAGLVLCGRGAFWPYQPAYGSEHTDTHGIWGRVARLISRRDRLVWLVTLAALAGAAAFVPTLEEDQVPQTELFLTDVDSVSAQEVLDRYFEADNASPLQAVVPAEEVPAVMEALRSHDGIATSPIPTLPSVFALPEPGDPTKPRVVDGKAIVFATLSDPADSAAAFETVRSVRADLHELDDRILVGGFSAIGLDIRETTDADRAKVIPAILLAIFVVLMVLLRALVAPALLLVANVLSFGATMGISALIFDHVFDFPVTDPSTTLIGFVFLVALGIDYSIFLMTRVREEAIRQGTHPGVLKGLSATGGVITSAGIVLAATFAALALIPLLFLVQIAFIVAFGVLVDALVVRSLLVPALSHDVGRLIWWPSALSREADHADAETAEMLRGAV